MDYCCLCGMARATPVHLCTAEVVDLLSKTPGGWAAADA